MADFVNERPKEVGLTQEKFADRCGIALKVIIKIEQGKTNLNMDMENQVLSLFGSELAPVNSKELNYESVKNVL